VTGTIRPPRTRPAPPPRRSAQRARPTGPPADPRIAERRDRVRRERRQRWGRWLGAGAVVVAVAGLAVALTRTPLLAVEAVEVRGVDGPVAEDVRDASGVRVGDPLVDADPEAVRARVEALPAVASAAVERAWPRRLVVRVAPEQPVVAAAAPQGVAVIGAGGRVLRRSAGPAWGLGLPVVRLEGDVLPEPGSRVTDELLGAVRVYEQAAGPFDRWLRRATLTADGSLRFDLPDGGILEFGPPEDVPAKLLAASTLLRGPVDRGCLAVVDVREPSRPIIRRVPGCDDVGPPTVVAPTPPRR
jgi:cell division protein FtsQ